MPIAIASTRSYLHGHCAKHRLHFVRSYLDIRGAPSWNALGRCLPRALDDGGGCASKESLGQDHGLMVASDGLANECEPLMSSGVVERPEIVKSREHFFGQVFLGLLCDVPNVLE